MTAKRKGPLALPVLIDTPVWQDYFRKEGRTFRQINALMDDGRVCCLDIVVAELLLTAKTEKEMKIFRDFTRIFPVLREPPSAWVEAAFLAYKLRRQRKRLSLRDCYVAVLARTHGVPLYTTNQALRRTRKALNFGLKFYSEPGKVRP